MKKIIAICLMACMLLTTAYAADTNNKKDIAEILEQEDIAGMKALNLLTEVNNQHKIKEGSISFMGALADRHTLLFVYQLDTQKAVEFAEINVKNIKGLFGQDKGFYDHKIVQDANKKQLIVKLSGVQYEALQQLDIELTLSTGEKIKDQLSKSQLKPLETYVSSYKEGLYVYSSALSTYVVGMKDNIIYNEKSNLLLENGEKPIQALAYKLNQGKKDQWYFMYPGMSESSAYLEVSGRRFEKGDHKFQYIMDKAVDKKEAIIYIHGFEPLSRENLQAKENVIEPDTYGLYYYKDTNQKESFIKYFVSDKVDTTRLNCKSLVEKGDINLYLYLTNQEFHLLLNENVSQKIDIFGSVRQINAFEVEIDPGSKVYLDIEAVKDQK